MPLFNPKNAREMAEILRDANGQARTIHIAGNGTKLLWGGRARQADDTVCMSALSSLVEYERNDLTVSVEAGMPFARLQRLLEANGQMIALDPPAFESATIGGVIAANSCGTWRRRFGTARDLVIGMSFATTAGQIVVSGGHVVKNVAGLDMAKLLIGSFGTLAAVVSVNLRVHPKPREWWTFLCSFDDAASAISRQREILESTLRPVSMELLNSAAANRLGLTGYTLAVRVAGTRSVLQRYARELSGGEGILGSGEESLWSEIREFTPTFLREHKLAVTVRVTAPASELVKILAIAPGPLLHRCGTGISYVFCNGYEAYQQFASAAQGLQCRFLVEAASANFMHDSVTDSDGFLSRPRSASASTEKLKNLFDPKGILNPGRLYARN